MLGLNFHKTFVPERRLIASLLEYAALGKEGNLYEMAEETGIPMGKYSGKMSAIRGYCLGTGLLTIEQGSDRGTQRPVLTPFGRVVYDVDRFLGEEITQWLAHINLCRNDIGAVAWNKVFADGADVLGYRFMRGQLEDYLVSYFGKAKKPRTGPILATYSDNAAFGRAMVLSFSGNVVTRNKAPILANWATAYSAIIIELMEEYFPRQFQVTVTDFATQTRFFDICMWKGADIEMLLSVVESKGYIVVDRQIRPWVVERRVGSDRIWPEIYCDIA